MDVVPKASGMSLHIGLNQVDPQHYHDQHGEPWSGELIACESDAQAMQELATARGLAATLLLTRDATTTAVLNALDQASGQLQAGDLLLVTYSGHGGQVADRNGDETDDFLDETWALFDRELVDDELYARWAKFKPGVRILVISDSCHSGSVTRMAEREQQRTQRVLKHAMTKGTEPPRFRAMPLGVVAGTYVANRAMYDSIQQEYPDGNNVTVPATVLLISGCQDNQLSEDGPINGLFTAALLHTWNNGRFSGDYRGFFTAIQQHMPPEQQPNYFLAGAPNPAFEQEEPFTV